MAVRFMLKFEPSQLILVRMPLWLALAHDLGPEWLCGVLGHRFCSSKVFTWIDGAYDRHTQLVISLPEGVRPNQVKAFLGWPMWDGEDEDEA